MRALGLGDNNTMPGQSFDDANAFHRIMRTFAATKMGAVLLRPTAHHLDQVITKLTGGRSSFAGIATGVPAVMLTTTGAKSGAPRTVAVLGVLHPDGVAVIASNYGSHKHPKVRAWLARHPRWTFHFTPTSASWVNAVEGFFAKLTRRRLQRGVFSSLVDLQAAINRYLAEHNCNPRPFSWTADPDRIIAAANRGYQVLDSIHSHVRHSK